MKTVLLLFCICSTIASAFSQTGVRRLSKDEFTNLLAGRSKSGSGFAADSGDTPISNAVNKGIDFGASLGFSFALRKVYEARLSPLDNTLQITTTAQPAFLLSTGVAFPLAGSGSSFRYGGSFYQKTTGTSNTGEATFVPYGFYALATVNLVAFNSAASGSAYNQKLDGGVGVGFRLNDNVLLAATFEMLTYRTPRDFLLEDGRRNQVLTGPGGTPITTLSQDDDAYFINRYQPSVSLKFFYLLAYDPTK